jgi:hypothetical protein
MDREVFYSGETVTATRMNDAHTDAEEAQQGNATRAGAAQGLAAEAHKYGGIVAGLEVTYATDTTVSVTAGAAVDNDGIAAVVPSTATVSLARTGPTPAGDITNAEAEGVTSAALAVTAGQEVWLGLYLVPDEISSDQVTDALGNNIYSKVADSFHFEILKGTEAAAGGASVRPALETGKILLADILVDENEAIREISSIKAVCASTADFNAIGYGPDDAEDLFGRRNDLVAIDHDAQAGDALKLWYDAVDTGETNNRAAVNIRQPEARRAVRELAEKLATIGSSAGFAGTELVGGKAFAGKTKSYPAGTESALNPTGVSLHGQIDELVDTINAKLPRGGTNDFQGDLSIIGKLLIQGDLLGYNHRNATWYKGPLSLLDYGPDPQAGFQVKADFTDVEDLVSSPSWDNRHFADLYQRNIGTPAAPTTAVGVSGVDEALALMAESVNEADTANRRMGLRAQRFTAAIGANVAVGVRTAPGYMLQTLPGVSGSIRLALASAAALSEVKLRFGFYNVNWPTDLSACYIELDGNAGTCKAVAINAAGTSYSSSDLLGAGEFAGANDEDVWDLQLVVQSPTLVRGAVIGSTGTPAEATIASGQMTDDDAGGTPKPLGYCAFAEVERLTGNDPTADLLRFLAWTTTR